MSTTTNKEFAAATFGGARIREIISGCSKFHPAAPRMGKGEKGEPQPQELKSKEFLPNIPLALSIHSLCPALPKPTAGFRGRFLSFPMSGNEQGVPSVLFFFFFFGKSLAPVPVWQAVGSSAEMGCVSKNDSCASGLLWMGRQIPIIGILLDTPTPPPSHIPSSVIPTFPIISLLLFRAAGRIFVDFFF